MSTLAVVPSDPRFDLARVVKHVKPPPRLVLLGEPGVGKTTFGAAAPEVVVVPTEDGALGIDVARLPREGKCRTHDDVLQALRVLRDGKHDYKWCALDTINGVDALIADMVVERDFKGIRTTRAGQEGYDAFARGEKATASEMRGVLSLLDELQQKRGMGIILLSHVGLHKQGNALGGDYQKFGGQMSKYSWELICGWADQVGHACRDVQVFADQKGKSGKATAIGSERWIVFEGGPGRDAKSRVGYEMPERILLSWEEYAAHLSADRVGALVDQAMGLLKEAPEKMRDAVKIKLDSDITGESLRAVGARKLEQLIGWLLAWKNNNQKKEG
jgi:hypothetical protein